MRINKFITLTVYILVSCWSYGQDTIYTDDKEKFDQVIRYCFAENAEQMTPKLKVKIDSIFQTFDFSSEELDCQYEFDFSLVLDSCGKILNCVPIDPIRSFPVLVAFQEKICILLENSDWLVKNRVITGNENYYFHRAVITLYSSCDPDEVIFADDVGYLYNDERVLAYKLNGEALYFNGMRARCY